MAGATARTGITSRKRAGTSALTFMAVAMPAPDFGVQPGRLTLAVAVILCDRVDEGTANCAAARAQPYDVTARATASHGGCWTARGRLSPITTGFENRLKAAIFESLLGPKGGRQPRR
jgi:hypothetical protein